MLELAFGNYLQNLIEEEKDMNMLNDLVVLIPKVWWYGWQDNKMRMVVKNLYLKIYKNVHGVVLKTA